MHVAPLMPCLPFCGVVDNDTDGDGLTDSQETGLGLSSNDESDVQNITIQGTRYYLIDTTQDGIYDSCYYPPSNLYPCSYSSSEYLIDIDGDTEWDYLYSPVTTSIRPYTNGQDNSDSEGFPLMYIIIIVVVIVGVVGVVVFLLYRYGYIGIEEELVYETPEQPQQPIQPQQPEDLLGPEDPLDFER